MQICNAAHNFYNTYFIQYLIFSICAKAALWPCFLIRSSCMTLLLGTDQNTTMHIRVILDQTFCRILLSSWILKMLHSLSKVVYKAYSRELYKALLVMKDEIVL